MSRKRRGKGSTSSQRSGGKKRSPKFVRELEGIAQMTREGSIYVKVDGEEEGVFVKVSKTRGALHGDLVRVAVTHEKTGRATRREGEIIAIVERSPRPFVGILHIAGDNAWVMMQSKTMPYDIEVPVPEGARRGMKVAAVVDGWRRGEPGPYGHVVDVLGLPGENDTEMHAILAEFGLPYRFSPEVNADADRIPAEISPSDRKGRRDFRDVLTFTIDPSDAKDYDDALSFRRLESGNFEVGVHIADVSWYVRPGSLIDKEARERGTSVYLVDRTVPMLPEALSNKLCSLRPGEEKLTFSAVFEVTPQAKVINPWFGRTIIRSDYRFDYDLAQSIIDAASAGLAAQKIIFPDGAGKTNLSAPHLLRQLTHTDAGLAATASLSGRFGEGSECGVVPVEIMDALLVLNGLALKLRKKRFAAGAVNFDRPEMKVIVDEAGKPIGVKQKFSREANWLIEEFMLLANRSVAEFVASGGKMGGKALRGAKTFVYRVHDEPNLEKLSGLREFAGNFGFRMGPIGEGHEIAKSLNELMASASDSPAISAIQLLALRSMAKACYSTDNIGHYGLAFKFYTHFTSPIRRYPDLMVHRLLALYLGGAESQSKDYYTEQCKHASEREVIAAEAERESIKYKIVEYMQDRIGNEYDGMVSGVTQWGLYVETSEEHIEGMVPLRTIKSDYYEFDEDRYRIVGRRTGNIYTLGDRVRIRVKATSLDQKLLDYELIEPEIPEISERTAKPAGRSIKASEREERTAKPTGRSIKASEREERTAKPTGRPKRGSGGSARSGRSGGSARDSAVSGSARSGRSGGSARSGRSGGSARDSAVSSGSTHPSRASRAGRSPRKKR